MTFHCCIFRGARMAMLLVALLSTAGASTAADKDLIVNYDQSKLLRLSRPVAEIVIGNPSIADVTVNGSSMLVVTGKTFGMTNIIALDADRKIIREQRVIVERDEHRVVNLHKAGVRQSYSCTPNCSPTLTIGDDSAYFDKIQKHSAAKTGFSNSEGQSTSGP